ncbi:UBA domain containing protein [Pyrenophora tritici-repentis]|nr:UBA domain-containing protein [Pyrenophora tritici-repentis]KAF7449144.1 UBA domain containing protein [Pyrenophora tritici-repentis]KAF7570852.1 UBA domain containing protein [Pyrenophora tritici-repentis]KAG9383917.1 UBA domain containing protein [Pyrenophora tritici-repentis]KAI0589131.1 UBA domain-containing protein [Pyrenophora tritici-repentis]
MSKLLGDRKSKQLVTILRAVPEYPESPESPAHCHSDEQDVAAQDYLRIKAGMSPSSAKSPASLLAGSVSIWGRKQKKATSNSSSSPKSKSKSKEHHKSLNYAIGTYKHGKIQWQRKDGSSSSSRTKKTLGPDRRSRPKIQIVIPSGRCDQPLPALPNFSPAGHGSDHDISPQSASHVFRRNSIVSPCAQSQPQAIPFGQLERTIHSTTGLQPSAPTHSSSSSYASEESDKSSVLSNRSSETSLEHDVSPIQRGPPQSSKYLPSGQTLVPDGTLESSPKITTNLDDEQLRRHAPSSALPRRYTHAPFGEEEAVFQITCTDHDAQHASHITKISRSPTLNRKSSKRSGPRQRTAASLCTGNQAIGRYIPGRFSDSPVVLSPTLSEAECALQKQLSACENLTDLPADDRERTTLAEGSPFRGDVRQPPSGGEAAGQHQWDLATIPLPDSPPPAVPRKSSKRKSVQTRVPTDHIASQLMRGRSRGSKTLKLMIPQYKRTSVAQVFTPETILDTKKPNITPQGAETVILGILRHLDHFEDLFSAALVNQGFYRVFKRHELSLIKSTLRKMSPPAWEFREIAFPGHDRLHAEDLEVTRPDEEYTTDGYLQLQKRDVQVIRAIKLEIMEKCQSFVRSEISAALMSACPAESARVDDALWRIWSFCKIFGSGKGREDDIVAQMDWLNGGVLVHQSTCTFSIMSTDFMNDTLVSAPESFGKGNEGGLSAEQLFDMMELWNCLGVLLQNFEGRTVQARQAGIYDNTDIRGGDIDGEEMMLDEWCYHLLTFGPRAVLKLTGPYHPSDPTAFKIAAENGWLNWKPPVARSTRRTFLKEAASRVYEDKIANTFARISTRDVQRQQSKIRLQRHIKELRERKNSGEHRRMIRMSQERPMSEWDTVIRNLTRPRVPAQGSENDLVTHVPALRSGTTFEQVYLPPICELPASGVNSRPSSPPRRTVAEPLLPTPSASTVPSNYNRYSIASSDPYTEERPPSTPRRTAAQPLLPTPSASTVQSYRDPYTMGSVSDRNSPPRRIVAQPLLPSPSTSASQSNRDWHRYSTGTFMPSILEDPPHHPLSVNPDSVHPAFRPQSASTPHHNNGLYYRHIRQRSEDQSSSASVRSAAHLQHEQQHNIYGSQSHENTADKAIYRIVEMGFTPEQAREALKLTDLGTGLRVDRAVELLLARQT